LVNWGLKGFVGVGAAVDGLLATLADNLGGDFDFGFVGNLYHQKPIKETNKLFPHNPPNLKRFLILPQKQSPNQIKPSRDLNFQLLRMSTFLLLKNYINDIRKYFHQQCFILNDQNKAVKYLHVDCLLLGHSLLRK
jgi:hypothetical protein